MKGVTVIQDGMSYFATNYLSWIIFMIVMMIIAGCVCYALTGKYGMTVVGIIVIIALTILLYVSHIQNPRTKILVDDSVSMSELSEHYNIIKQESDNVFIVEEKK